MRTANRGVWAWLVSLFQPQAKTPLIEYIEIEKGVPVTSSEDREAIASLKNHPGAIALLNRLKLQRAVLEDRLRTVRHVDIRDVDLLQLGITWVRFVESQIREASKNIETQATRPASADDNEEFERVRSFIESVRTTNPSE